MPSATAPASPLPHPALQRAIVQDASGQPHLIQDAAIPKLLPGTILVRTSAVALNPSDYKMGSSFPTPDAVVGMDFAGEIVKMDQDAVQLRPDLKVGDEVCGVIHGSNPAGSDNGSFAEYLRAPAGLVLKAPRTVMRPEEAASLGVALATNALALWDALGLPVSPEDPAAEPLDVLVYGGSTTCGTMAIQLLKL